MRTGDYGQTLENGWFFYFIALRTIISSIIIHRVYIIHIFAQPAYSTRVLVVDNFRIADRREYSVNTLNGTSVVECSIVKLSSTNVKLDTVQTSSYIGIGEKLETLITHRRVVCAMYSGV